MDKIAKLQAKWNGILAREFAADAAADSTEGGVAVEPLPLWNSESLSVATEALQGFAIEDAATSRDWRPDGELAGISELVEGRGSQECPGAIAGYRASCGKCDAEGPIHDSPVAAQASASYHNRQRHAAALAHGVEVARVKAESHDEHERCPTEGEAYGWEDAKYCEQCHGPISMNLAGDGEGIDERGQGAEASERRRLDWELPDDFHLQEGPEAVEPGKPGHGRAMRQCFRADGSPIRDPLAIRRYMRTLSERDHRLERLKAWLRATPKRRVARARKAWDERYRTAAKAAARGKALAEEPAGVYDGDGNRVTDPVAVRRYLKARKKWAEKYRPKAKRAAGGGKHWNRRRDGVGTGRYKRLPNWENLWLSKGEAEELQAAAQERLEADSEYRVLLSRRNGERKLYRF